MKNYKWILFFSLSILALLLPKTTTAINCVGGSTVTCESTDGNDSILVTRCDAPATDCVRIIDQDGVFFNFDPTMTAVSVDALGGSDEIQVDLDLNNDFVGNISIMGSDPTASDLLILNGSTVQDFIEVAPTAIDGAGVEDSTGLSLTFGTIERFIYNGQGGDDELTFLGTVSEDAIAHIPGTNLDAGKISLFSFSQGEALIPVEYLNLGSLGRAVIDGQFPGDSLLLEGTPAEDEINVSVTVLPSVDFLFLTPQGPRVPISTENINRFILETLSGDDLINLSALSAFQGDVIVHGGEGNDRLLFTGGSLGYSIDAFLSLVVALPSGGGFFTGMEEVSIFAGGTNVSFFSGSAANDSLIYTPQASDGGSLLDVGKNQFYTLQGVGALSINLAGGTSDTLTLEGGPGNDAIDLTNPGVPQIGVQGLLPVNFTGVEFLMVNGQAGDDTFNVIGLAGIDVLLDGGPHANGDTLNFDAQGLGVTANSSSIMAAGRDPVSYFNIENVGISNATFTQPPPGGTVQFSAGVFRFFENDVFATIIVTRNGDGVGEVSVDFATSDGTGIAGTDYIPISGPLTWPNGVTGDMTFTVSLIDNQLEELAARTVNLTLSNLVTTGGAELGSASAMLLISDNEGGEGNVVSASGNGCSLHRSISPQAWTGTLIYLLSLVAWRLWKPALSLIRID